MTNEPKIDIEAYKARQLAEQEEERKLKALEYHHEVRFKDQLHPIIDHFLISHIYTKTKIGTNSATFDGHTPLWSFYSAKQEEQYPPVILVDENGMITPNDTQISMELLDNIGAIRRLVSRISPKARMKIEDVMKDNGVHVPLPRQREELNWDFPTELANNKLVWVPIIKLKDPDYIDSMDWEYFVNLLVQWESEDKDPRLNLIHKAQILKGVDTRVNTNSLVVLNAGVGKSMHFQIHGINYDRVTKNSFLGFAKSKDEVYKGTLDGTDLPIAIDQIEVGSWGIMDFLFNIMESGEAMVSSGAMSFKVKSKSPISLLANPLGDNFNPEKGFSVILSHLSDNPAVGRRFGIIAYDTKYSIIKTKLTSQSLMWWKDTSTFFRAIEQYLRKHIAAVYRDPKLWDYLNKDIPGYATQIKILADACTDSTIKTFLMAHGEAGQTRVRAAAFNASLVDHLPELKQDTFRIEDVIEHAEEDLLPQIISINMESANNIVNTIIEEKELLRNVYLRSTPDYMREIVYAVEYMKHQGAISDVFMLSTTDYKPSASTYANIGQCMRKLIKRKKGITTFNKMVSRLFNFTFEPLETDLKITITNMKPVIQMPKMPKMPKMPNGEETENNEVSPKLGILGKTGINLDPRIDEMMSYISPKIGYELQQISGYFKWDQVETYDLLEIMEKEGLVEREYAERGELWWVSDTVVQQEFEVEKPRSLNEQMKKVLQVISEMERISGSVKDSDMYETLETEHGINRTEGSRFVSMLMKDGTIYMPRPGYYRRSD